ncbi:AAA family ATPase [Vibrio hannami]|uniref:AAA family ATPase n=1 Tax=Vibrio hannami TaxID=2717094 RepID=UPI00240F6F55|nr:AAA family ATPase [Vibrio hannami]MDG3087328.1 AAA family ATPase [Vibrio hannami]
MSSAEQKKQGGGLTPQAEAPKVPTSLDDLDVPAVILENLVLKHLAAYPKSNVIELSRSLGVISQFVDGILQKLREKAQVEVFQAERNAFQTDNSGTQVRYALSEQGAEEADKAFAKDAYVGPMPVSLRRYNEMVQKQDVRERVVTRTDVERALSDVYGSERLIPVIGPAINSGRALLLYGHAGSGKTFVAERILNAHHTSVYVPHAVYAGGNIIKVFSPQHHKPVPQAENSLLSARLDQQYDKRWVLCQRPSIQIGGELTMDMVEVNHSEQSKVWTAPLQMMANNGILVIDDLGRQPVPVDTILNRWIVPMEYFYDHLGLPNGQQITVPFILTLAFSTNLDPQKIADPAFLRRLGYKIQFYALKESEYTSLWKDNTDRKKLGLPEESVSKLLSLHNHYSVGYFPCIPKDIVGISRDIIAFEEIDPVITPDIMERAWDLYFTSDGKGGVI